MTDKVFDPNSPLHYPLRRYGMDHDLYNWSMLTDRPKVQWPNNKPLAVWVNINLEFFPLNQKGVPFKVPGGMTMPYPDLRHYSLRDYGNRVGLFRILKALDKFNITPTFAVNTELAVRTPYLVQLLKSRGNEVLCHGWNMDSLHHGKMDRADESELISRSVNQLRDLTGQAVTGWLSPARNQSQNTLALLAENGISYCADWVNDDMPYRFKQENLWAMPLSTELEDFYILGNNLHSEASYVEQINDACDFLLQEAATQGGRMLTLNIHPWLLGQPHRIQYFEQILSRLSQQPIWSASASDILHAFSEQQTVAKS
ncbi:polysaccharide deacetylase family protein [Rheinheimera salexigens]|uniref:Polysaccharide deacetylase n=1 Tax=Rheinheimera salexigens TaxID=1628148 RepID=A0A1E7Q7U5_9GAMM|nr:polysaccharide deacetylase family protein [Rheinheimera salexigens]OEY70171.1 polysaccharide deacetylase [Rheinheimera salexigens]